MSEVRTYEENGPAWYSVGPVGEHILDLVESVIDDNLTVDDFVKKLDRFGLNEAEISELLWSEGLAS